MTSNFDNGRLVDNSMPLHSQSMLTEDQNGNAYWLVLDTCSTNDDHVDWDAVNYLCEVLGIDQPAALSWAHRVRAVALLIDD